MTDHDLSHPVFQTVEQYDMLKARLFHLEQELNVECNNYARGKGYAFMFPHHLRNIVRLTEKEQTNEA